MANLLDERIDHHQSNGVEICAQSGAYFIPRAPIPRYRRYYRSIDLLERLGCNRCVAPDSVGRATLKKAGLAAPLACQEER